MTAVTLTKYLYDKYKDSPSQFCVIKQNKNVPNVHSISLVNPDRMSNVLKYITVDVALFNSPYVFQASLSRLKCS